MSRLRRAAVALMAVWLGSQLYADQQAIAFPGQEQRASAAPVGQATVAGHVMDATDGRGLGGVLVTLAGASLGFSRPQSPRSLSARTDATGGFSFRDLPGGIYTVSVRADGYSSPSSSVGQSSVAMTLNIGDGAKVSGVVIRLSAASSIEGTVLSTSDQPLLATNVRALAWQTIGGRRLLVQRGATRTGSDGRYRIDGLPTGEYVVWVPSVLVSAPVDAVRRYEADQLQLLTLTASKPLEVAGMMIRSYGTPLPQASTLGDLMVHPPTFWPDGQSPSQSVTVSLSPGQHRSQIDFRLPPVPTWRISGRLVGDPLSLSQIVVRAVRDGADQLYSQAALEAAGTLTNERGEFTLVGLPSGRYDLVVRREPPPDYSGLEPGTTLVFGRGKPPGTVMTRDGALGQAPVSDGRVWWATVRILVDKADVKDVDVPINAGFRLAGRVISEDGVPLSSELLRGFALSIEATVPTGSALIRGVSDSVGAVRSATMTPGRYYIRARSLPSNWALRSVRLGAEDVTERAVTLDRDRDDLQILLTNRPNRLTGTVSPTVGTMDAGALVLVFPTDQRLWEDYGLNPSRLRQMSVVTPGRYDFSGLPTGEYFVTALPEFAMGEWRDRDMLRRISQRSERVRISDSSNVVMNLKTSSPIER